MKGSEKKEREQNELFCASGHWRTASLKQPAAGHLSDPHLSTKKITSQWVAMSVLQSAKHIKELIVPLLGRDFYICNWFQFTEIWYFLPLKKNHLWVTTVCKEVFGKIKISVYIYVNWRYNFSPWPKHNFFPLHSEATLADHSRNGITLLWNSHDTKDSVICKCDPSKDSVKHLLREGSKAPSSSRYMPAYWCVHLHSGKMRMTPPITDKR